MEMQIERVLVCLLCLFSNSSALQTTLFSVVQTGARIVSPSSAVTTNVRSRSVCATWCHSNPACRSFSYSQSRQECYRHELRSTDPGVIIADDDQFSISSLYGQEANVPYVAPTTTTTVAPTTTTMAPPTTEAPTENLEGCLITFPGCASPFTYNGVTYTNGCTKVNNNGVCWCATATIYDGGWQNC